MRVLCYVSIVVGLYAIVQFHTGLDLFRSEHLQRSYRPYYNNTWHAVGIFSHHLTFGGVYLLLSAVFAALALPKELSPKLRLLYALAATVCLSSAVCSLGRSIWLGAVAGGTIFLSLLIPVKIRLAIFLAMICLAVSFWLSAAHLKKMEFARSGLGSRILTVASLEANKDRLMMWKAGIDIVKDYPIFGLGPNMFHQMEPYYRRIAESNRHTFQHKPQVGLHNIYLQNWVDFGIAGLLGFLWIYLSVIGAILSRIRRATVVKSMDHALQMGIMAGLCGNLVSGFFENNFRDGEVQTLILTLMGIALILWKKTNPATRPECTTHRPDIRINRKADNTASDKIVAL